MKVGDYVTDMWGNRGIIVRQPERTSEVVLVAWTYRKLIAVSSKVNPRMVRNNEWCNKCQLQLLSVA